MDLQRASIVLRPRSTLELVDLAFRFVFGVKKQVYFNLAAILVPLPTAFLTWLWVKDVVPPFFVWVLALIIGATSQGAYTIAAGQLMFAPQTETRAVWRSLLGRLPAYLGALMFSRLLFLVSFFLLWSRGVFVHEACLLEKAGPRASWTRASAFARSDSGETTSVLFSMFGLQVASILVFELLGHAISEYVLLIPNVGGSLFEDGISAYALLGYLCSVPFAATLRFLSYINSRTRRDGWDIQVRFMALAAEPHVG